jgi:hypothetical protein
MSILKPRTRMVYCRLSEEEFAQVSNAYVELGLRNLSDFMRVAMRRALMRLESSEETSLAEEVHGRLVEIEKNLDVIMTHLEWLTRSAEQEDTTAE